ncbi:hypothetical protein HH800_06430 [Sphingobium yanoikuyae]|uniref:Nucleotidyl transferase AbiEii/AbiGii toxin family protein n=2 Tax=Sphingobium yanoikuyae TaxID=13690 RepID=A0A6M4G4N6_SPHYA|nr:hypothetical protein HH800_06430 [Sphingobium yanoikuyae]
MSRWRPQFEAALTMLAQISAAMDAKGYRPPVLVGGGAVELYTQSAISTGDFDLVSSQQMALESVMVDHGFVRPKGAGLSLRGWIHPDLKLGFEVVGSRLLDGFADQDFLQVIEIGEHGAVAVISAEDLIADRMGQYASGSADEMLGQAKALFKLSQGLDRDYMERRIREETAQDYGIQDLEDQA